MAYLEGFGFMLCMSLLKLTATATVSKGGTVSEGQGDLVFTHVLYRHGDKTPSNFFLNDPYNNPIDWPVGFGELTNTGKAQHCKLGQWLRGRYDTDFLPEQYSEQNIYVRSTDTDRTIASALSNLAGIYPPTGDQIWNKTIHWQPIPVHTVPDSDDFLLGNGPPCPANSQMLAQVIPSSDLQDIANEYRSQIDYVLQNSGVSLNISLFEQLMQIMTIRDTLSIETLYMKPLPAWAKPIYPSDWIDRVGIQGYTIYSYTPQLTKFRSGYLLKDILDRCIAKVKNTLTPNLSVYVYSAHDYNIAMMLKGLGMWDNKFVQYAAALLFELRIHENVPYLEIFYKRSADVKTPEILFIPNCGYSCPLTTMYAIFDNILPKNDRQTECNSIS